MFDDEIEDQFQLYQDAAQQQKDLDLDAMMLDEIEQQEQAELEELLSALPTSTAVNAQTRPSSPTPTIYSDDDYDAIFMDFISSQTEQSGQPVASSQQDVEMSL